VVSLIF